jgi:hypothetical protein
MKITKTQLRQIIKEEIQKEAAAFGTSGAKFGGSTGHSYSGSKTSGRKPMSGSPSNPNTKSLGNVGGVEVTRTKGPENTAPAISYKDGKAVPFAGKIEKYNGYPKKAKYNGKLKQWETVDGIALKDSEGTLRIPDAKEMAK